MSNFLNNSAGRQWLPAINSVWRWWRGLVLAGVGMVALVAVAACGAGNVDGSAVSTPAAASPAVEDTTPALSAEDQQLVSDMRADFNFDSSVGDQEIATWGESACSDRQIGTSQSDVITETESEWSNTSAMQGDQMVRAAEKDICPDQLPAATVTYIVTGTSGADVTYGPAGSDFTGTVPMRISKPLGTPSYYAITAQLQGYGSVKCEIDVDGIAVATGEANGGYNIASCEISQDFSGTWQDDNS